MKIYLAPPSAVQEDDQLLDREETVKMPLELGPNTITLVEVEVGDKRSEVIIGTDEGVSFIQ